MAKRHEQMRLPLLPPDRGRDAEGRIVDAEGNIYDDEGVNISQEAPSEEYKEGLRMARGQNERENKNWPEETIKAMARQYAHDIRKKKELRAKAARKERRRAKK